MSVDYIRPVSGRDFNAGKITEWTATRKWLAHTTSRFDPDTAIIAYGWAQGILPMPYISLLGTSPNPLVSLLCRRLTCKQDKNSPQHWEIEAEYSSEPLTLPEKQAQDQENPIDRPAKVRWNSAKYNKPCVVDINDDLILNSAGDPLEGAEFDQSRWTITIVKNVAAVPTVIFTYTDAINDVDMVIQGVTIPQYCAKIMSLEISDEEVAQVGEDEITYFVFTVTLELRPETWSLKLLDQGFRQKSPGDATKRVLIQDDSVPAKNITKPWPLDGSGGKVSNPSPSTAHMLEFDVYQEADFSVLPGISDAEGEEGE